MRRRWTLRLTLLAFALALGMGLVLWFSVDATSVDEVQVRINRLKPFFAIARWWLIMLLAVFWPTWVGRLSRRAQWSASRTAALLALRWRVVVWLLLIELMLGQNLVGRVLAAVREGGA